MASFGVIWRHLALFGVIWHYLASFGVNLLLNCNLPILIFMYLASFGVQKHLFGDNFLQNWTLLIWIFIFCTYLASMFTKLNTTHLNFYLFSLIWRHLASKNANLASRFTKLNTTHLIFIYLGSFGVQKYTFGVTFY